MNSESSTPNTKPQEVDFHESATSGVCRKAVWVEYVGRTALVLTGPYTGLRYWFDQPGARLVVDGRDRHALLSVPLLRGVTTAN